MRLLIAGITWPPETFIGRLASGLANRGVDVTVGCAERPRPGDIGANHLSWLSMPSWSTSPPIRLMRLAGEAIAAAIRGHQDVRTLRRAMPGAAPSASRLAEWNLLLPYAGRRWDAMYLPGNSAAIAALPAFDLGMPVIVSCRGSQVSVAPHNPRRADLAEGLRATFERAAAVHCVSVAIVRDAAEFGLDPAKVAVIRPAVDPTVFAPRASAQCAGRFRIVSTGNLSWVKGYEYALMAVRRAVDAGIPLQYEIIGDGPERQRILFTIEDLQLSNHVAMLGKLPPARVVELLQSADAFLLSSLSEGISNAVLEAMSCGLAVVTTDCGGMREAVTDGVEGFVTPVRAPEAMGDALIRLARDADLRQSMGEAARRRILADFTLDHQIDEWMVLLQRVTDSGTRR